MNDLLATMTEALVKGYTVRVETRKAICSSDIIIVVSDGHYSKARYTSITYLQLVSDLVHDTIFSMIEDIEEHKKVKGE